MSIRRRLVLSFGVILVLFGLNLSIFFWSNQRRSATVEDLRRAIRRQILLSSISQTLNDNQKQIALLSNVMAEGAITGAAPEEVSEFDRKLDATKQQILEQRELSDENSRAEIDAMSSAFNELAASWHTFYTNFGVNQTKAIIELATRSDPLSQRVIQLMLPQLLETEKQRVDLASANFYQVAQLTNRMTVLIFGISTVVAILVAVRLSRQLVRELGALKLGASKIGQGNLSERIAVSGHDELADLANAFNDMSENLLAARTQLTEANTEPERRHTEVEHQRQVSESLLVNILPVQVARELQSNGKVEPKYFEDVTIMFTDFVAFTLSTERFAAEELVQILHEYFTAFDQIIERYGLEKLKTIGDSYMCVAGLPVRNPSHPVDAVMAAFEILQAVNDRSRVDGGVRWEVRIGVHSGPVVAGVVGIQKFAFDIWGDTVNYASRMESTAAPGSINLSERTFSRVKDFFQCEYRGKVLTKEKKEFDMYFAKGILPSLIDDPTRLPPPAFLRRYRVYFQKEPPAFPAFLVRPELSRLTL